MVQLTPLRVSYAALRVATRLSGRIPCASLSYTPASASMTSASTTLYAVPKVPDPTLSLLGSDQRFPVRRVYCVGQNYRAHALEMGSNPDRSPPFFFTKPRDAAVDVSEPGAKIHYPPKTNDLHHEVELVVAIGRGGRGISPEVALKHVFAYGVGVDLTRRDMQAAARKVGRPWDCSKGFDSSGPVGTLTPVNKMDQELAFEEREVTLSVDGVSRQGSVLGDMIWSVPEMIAGLSELFTLEAGDVLFTGTPAGVSALQVGNAVEARVQGLEPCRFEVAPPLPPSAGDP